MFPSSVIVHELTIGNYRTPHDASFFDSCFFWGAFVRGLESCSTYVFFCSFLNCEPEVLWAELREGSEAIPVSLRHTYKRMYWLLAAHTKHSCEACRSVSTLSMSVWNKCTVCTLLCSSLNSLTVSMVKMRIVSKRVRQGESLVVDRAWIRMS
jgi:hypothetical protein